MSRLTKSQGQRPRRWTIIALASVLLFSVTASVVVLVRDDRGMTFIRLEAEKAVLIAQMEAAVQVQAEQAGLLAGQLMSDPGDPGQMDGGSMDNHIAMAEPDTSTAAVEGSGQNGSSLDSSTDGLGASLPHHPEMIAASQSFHEAVAGLRQLMVTSEQSLLDDVVTAYALFAASIAEFDAQSHDGSVAMSFYHNNTQTYEARLHSTLIVFGGNTSSRLGSAIENSRSAELLLAVALPVILVAGLLAAIYLFRTVATRRRLNTLEGLIKDKDEFIAAVSHELRTPLTGIVGFAELLHESDQALAPHERAELIASIAEQGREVTAIVEDLLVAARAEIGQLTIHSSALDLRAEAAHVLETLQPEAANVELTETESSQILGDPARIRQILRNLVTNAVRYGSGVARIECGRTAAQGYLQVHSNGSPIPYEDRERIFEPYQRAHDEPQMPGAIGLGLSVARRLARLMDGDLSYAHREGMNIFELTLPLAISAQASAPPAFEHAAG